MDIEKLQEIMRKHHIVSNDEAETAINFVRDLLEAEAVYTEKKEPQATVGIREMYIAANCVSDLCIYLDD